MDEMEFEKIEGVSPVEMLRIFQNWLDLVPLPHVILDKDHLVIWSNSAAREFFSSSEIVVMSRNMIIFADPDLQCKYELFFNDVRVGQSVSAFSTSLHNESIVLRGRLIGEVSGHPVLGMSFFHSSLHIDSAADDSNFARIFGLTNGEARVVRGLSSGLNADQVSEKFNISLETVRTHIRRVYVKLGVSTREAMLAQVRPYLTFA